MFLIDQWVEKYIKDASENGEFDNLAGRGKPLVLDDDSGVPEELRAAYRILKNAGYLPPELQDRKEVIELDHMLKSVMPDNPEFYVLDKRLKVLKLRLQQASISTDFLDGHYKDELNKKFKGD
ncbi:DUF1992 domain-containing protein [Enterobacteriaceae bacterium Kacie_13]|nr:DUF1992 domain-containing protein [Enterobacteriaceae bacterium Kacie_13]